MAKSKLIMPLIYSFVARGHSVLAEFTKYQGNFSTVAIECLQKAPLENNRFTYTCDGHTFNFLTENGFTYLVVADQETGRSLPFGYLERIKEEFQSKYGDKAQTAGAHSLNKAFGPRLQAQMDYCMANPHEISKIADVKRQVNDVKNIMSDNIEKVLNRGEKIELLVDKAEGLRGQADNFRRQG